MDQIRQKFASVRWVEFVTSIIPVLSAPRTQSKYMGLEQNRNTVQCTLLLNLLLLLLLLLFLVCSHD